MRDVFLVLFVFGASLHAQTPAAAPATDPQVQMLGSQVQALGEQIAALQKQITALQKPAPAARPLPDLAGDALHEAAKRCPEWASFVSVTVGGTAAPSVTCLASLKDAKKARPQ